MTKKTNEKYVFGATLQTTLQNVICNMERLNLTLSKADYQQCLQLCRKGTSNISTLNRAQILLAMHNGAAIPEIIKVLGIERTGLWRLRSQYLRCGLKDALADHRRKQDVANTA